MIDAAQLFEAKQQLDELKPNNNYEAGRLALARARIAESTGDSEQSLGHLRTALFVSDGLEKALLGSVQRQVFALELGQREWAAALETYDSLRSDYAGELTVPEKLAGDELIALVASDRSLSTRGELECRCDKENGDPLWSARLLRREFAFSEIAGAVDRFEVRCETRQFTGKVVADTTWKVPDSWGKCTLFVFGEEGAKFRLVELPTQIATTQPVPDPPQP